MAKLGWGQSRYSTRNVWVSSVLIITVLIILFSLTLIIVGVGTVFLPSTKSHLGHHLTSTLHTNLHGGDQWVELISWEPRAFVYHNFLSKKECEYLIDVAKPHMRRAVVVDNETGAFLYRGQDKIITEIEQRIADWTFIPANHGEDLQVLHYEEGQKYDAHNDYFTDEYHTKNGDQRMDTILIYLSDVEEGGETVFPMAKGIHSGLPYWNNLSNCGKGGLSIKPKMGDALLFWSMNPDGTLDPLSLHAACPVIRGNKWSCTKWLHVKKNQY